MDDEIDVVVTGHTNWAVNCVLDGKIVTGAAPSGPARHGHRPDDQPPHAGRPLGDGQQPDRHERRAAAPDRRSSTSTARCRAPLANRIIGKITATITRTANPAGESALGDVIADAQRFDATSLAGTGSQSRS